MSAIEIKIEKKNLDKLKGEIDDKMLNALESIGMLAEGYAKTNLQKQIISGATTPRTGALINSITYEIINNNKQKGVAVGSKLEYAPYVEYGTGEYYPNGGRKTPWVYQDSAGNWHRTTGMKPRPYLKPAIEEHVEEYKQIIASEMK